MDTSSLMFPKPKDKKKQPKKDKVADSRRFSILVDDLTRCAECGRRNVNLHEVFFGTANRSLSKKYGLVVPFCEELHHNQADSKGVHFDSKLDKKWKKKAQRVFMKHYNKTKDEFKSIFGKNYL